MSSIGSAVGGKVGGGESVNQTQYPYFTSPGGTTPQQQALASYDYGQNLLEGQAQFEGSGEGGATGMSTMATQTAGGASTGKALQLAGMSDIDQEAEYGAYQNAINIDQQNNANLLAEQQQNLQTSLGSASTLGSLAGQAASQNTGGSAS